MCGAEAAMRVLQQAEERLSRWPTGFKGLTISEMQHMYMEAQ